MQGIRNVYKLKPGKAGYSLTLLQLSFNLCHCVKVHDCLFVQNNKNYYIQFTYWNRLLDYFPSDN